MHPDRRVSNLKVVSFGTLHAPEEDMMKETSDATLGPIDPKRLVPGPTDMTVVRHDMIAGREVYLLPAVRHDDHSMRTDHVIRVAGARATSSGRYRVGGVPRGVSRRQVDGGPLVPGPWAYVYELAGVIDNHGGTGAESALNRAAGTEHDLRSGDVIRFDEHEYKITLDARGFVRLEMR